MINRDTRLGESCLNVLDSMSKDLRMNSDSPSENLPEPNSSASPTSTVGEATQVSEAEYLRSEGKRILAEVEEAQKKRHRLGLPKQLLRRNLDQQKLAEKQTLA